jgi:nitrite reductase/ring-hydroxylating ferredoxin subunit
MTTQYRRALSGATPAQRQFLQTSRDRFLAYRDRCPNRQCMADAYVGRMREIRDIMEGRWQAR